MPISISVSTTTLAGLVDALLQPNPDDVGPFGPAGPVIGDHRWLELNPQPLPPRPHPWRAGPSPDPWGPQPDPWRFAITVRAVVDQLISQYEQAGIIVVGGSVGDADRLREAGAATIRQLVDDLCGTPPRPRPFPGPWGGVLDPGELDPRALLVAGAQLHRAAVGLADGHPLTATLAEAADQLLQTAVTRIEG